MPKETVKGSKRSSLQKCHFRVQNLRILNFLCFWVFFPCSKFRVIFGIFFDQDLCF
jgi:hypothetical protein